MKKYQSDKCEYSTCENAPLAHNLCSGHYKQYLKGIKLKPLRKKLSANANQGICTVEGCQEEQHTKNICQRHYDMAIYRMKKSKSEAIPNE